MTTATPADTMPAYVTRDGKYVATLESENDALRWFHRHCSQSMSYELEHGGYAVTTEPPADAATYGTELTADYVGHIKDAEWPHYAWQVTLTRAGRTYSLPYKMGVGHIQTKCGKHIESTVRGYHDMPCDHTRCYNAGPQPEPPTLYDVLCNLKADGTQGETFEEWCGNYGYDTDSRKAMDTYLACQESETQTRKLFGDDFSRLMEDDTYV